jgi:glyoxylase I family protein
MSQKQQIEALTPLLNVRDVEVSMNFYTHTLGFEVVGEWTLEERVRWVRLKNGSVELMLNSSDQSSDDDMARSRRSGAASFSDTVLYLTVPDVDALHSTLKARGFSVTDPFKTEYGVREFHCRDLDGYELAFVSRL